MKDVIAECLKSLDDLSRWDENIFKVVCKTASCCCVSILEALDDELAKTREKDLKIVGKRKRTIVTKFGSFVVKRRFYRGKDGTSKFLLDEALGLRKRGQATFSLEATATRLASQMPFREAAKTLEETSGGILSHQMIHRILQSAGSNLDLSEKKEAESLTQDGLIPDSKNKKVEHLFVEADGTVISLQRAAKKKAEAKLVVAHEGWERVGKNKWALKNKTILAGFHSSKDTWDRFSTNLLKLYSPEILARLIMGGDGASWIHDGSTLFADSTYQLDRFHIKRALLRASGKIGVANQTYNLATCGKLDEALAVLFNEGKDNPERKADLYKAANYLKNNSCGLIDYRERIEDKDESMRGLGAIESNIDKILANRMKKRGMAWSLEGAHHMAKVIQMQANGTWENLLNNHKPHSKSERLKTAFATVKQTFNQDPALWLQARMPALLGPHQGRPWVKALRDIAHVTPAGMQS